jgi:polyhydroxyalkanoate synthesis regulator phasin
VNQLDGLRRYLDAATTLTQITRGRAEDIVRDLVASGELERTRAQEWIEDLVKRSREASELLVASVAAEVERQLSDRGLKNLDLDDLAQRVAGILEHAGTVGRNVTMPKVWARGGGGATATTAATRASSPNGAGSESKSASAKASGKKKDGSDKTSAKAGKKTESKKDGPKKSEHKKPDSNKTDPKVTESNTIQSAQSHEHAAEDRTGPPDHGVTT